MPICFRGSSMMICLGWHICLILLVACLPPLSQQRTIDVSDEVSITKPLEHFWTSTGFSPTINQQTAEFLLSGDVLLNLALIGALPHRGLTHVRVHWLLDLVTVTDVTEDIPSYNFDNLDKFLMWMHSRGLSPGFELMGNPSDYFHDFQTQKKQWTDLLQKLIKRYIDMFGSEVVRGWRFETLNEPDLEQYNRWGLTVDDYLAYIQETSSVLKSFGLGLWGPAGLFKDPEHHPRCWAVRHLCLQSRDSCPFSVASFHGKGEGVINKVIDRGIEIAGLFNVTGLPLANNEADPLSGWWRPEQWRADVRYAAAVVQVVIGHVYQQQRYNSSVVAISNDNAFLSEHPHQWTQRTLFARFQINNVLENYTLMFEKPVYAALTLLSLLGNQTLALDYEPGNPGWSMIATSEGSRRTILLTLNRDTLLNDTADGEENVNLRIELPDLNVEGRGMIYLINNRIANPARTWANAGSPDEPDDKVSRKLRRKQGPIGLGLLTLKAHTKRFDWQYRLRIPSVVLFNICYKDEPEPGRVTQLRYMSIAHNQILLLWSDALVASKCLLTYTVEYRESPEDDFQSVTNRQFLTNSFTFDGCIQQRSRGDCDKTVSVDGEYRVAAVDYWGRRGLSSDTITTDRSTNNAKYYF